jgi:hypothetical protein
VIHSQYGPTCTPDVLVPGSTFEPILVRACPCDADVSLIDLDRHEPAQVTNRAKKPATIARRVCNPCFVVIQEDERDVFDRGKPIRSDLGCDKPDSPGS